MRRAIPVCIRRVTTLLNHNRPDVVELARSYADDVSELDNESTRRYERHERLGASEDAPGAVHEIGRIAEVRMVHDVRDVHE
jgi:hypothetical protein